MGNPALRLPPGAQLVDPGQQGLRLPPGATLIDSPAQAQPQSPTQPGMLSRAWNWANTGLLSPDQVRKTLTYTGPMAGAEAQGPDNSDAALTAEMNASPSDWDVKHPYLGAARRGLLGFSRDTMRTLSGLTSPVSIATMAAGPVSKIPGTVGILGKVASGAAAGAFAGMGAKSALENAPAAVQGDPDAIQGGLNGLAMLTGGAAGAKADLWDPLAGKIAPSAAEGALGVRAIDRRRLADKTEIGKTVLNDLKSNAPVDLADEANTKISDLTNQLEQLADKSKAYVSLKPAYDALDDLQNVAQKQNSAAELKVIGKVRQQLSARYDPQTRAFSGSAIPVDLTARELLDLKRGIGKLKNWDSPSEAALAGPIIDQVYGAMDGELDRAIPDSAPLNHKISVMLKVANRAEEAANNAGAVQKGFGRIAAQTGALTAPAGAGAALGYALGGPPGAAIGAVAGVPIGSFAQEAISSPTARIGFSRMLEPTGIDTPPTKFISSQSPALRKPVIGSLAASVARGREQNDEQVPDGYHRVSSFLRKNPSRK